MTQTPSDGESPWWITAPPGGAGDDTPPPIDPWAPPPAAGPHPVPLSGPTGPPAVSGENAGARRGAAVSGWPTSRAVLTALIAVFAAVLGGGVGAVIGIHVGRPAPTVTVYPQGATTAAVQASAEKSQSVIEAVAAAMAPAVVSIDEQGPQISGTGSGVIIRSDGYILTNNHVVSGAANGGTLTVTFADGRTSVAHIVGRDPSSDLAVIRVPVVGLPVARLGSSASLQVGETVLAFGSPLGLQGTVTSGIVSALHRPVHLSDPTESDTNAVIDAVQTDAPINPGNSGGPLVNTEGQVIGIDSAIATLGSGAGGIPGEATQSGNIGVGFAIPIDSALQVTNEIIATGHAVHAELGVAATDAPGESGALIRSVLPGSPAAASGLRAGDVVTRFGTFTIIDADTLVVAVRHYQPGQTVSLSYRRNGTSHSVTATLGSVID